MIGRLAALILLSAVNLIRTAEVPQLISLTEVQLGDNITFTCPISDKEGQFFYWYKQSLGYMMYKVAAGIFGVIKLSEEFQDSHLTVTKGDNQYFLNIRNVSKEDEATYFCQNGTAYSQTTINGTFLAVKDPNEQKTVYVKQTPETESVQPGDSVTLQCSLLSKNKENSVQCPGEHSVHWFRAGSGRFDPGVIYTHRSRSNEPEERSCVYSWSKTIQDSSDAGTYYCAVVTCGQILFGEGTKVDTKSDTIVLVLGVLLACCVMVIAAFIFHVSRRKVCEHCKGAMAAMHHGGHDRSTVDRSNELDGEGAVNYVALSFSTKNAKRQKRDTPRDYLYAKVEYRRADTNVPHQPTFQE